MKTHNNTHRLRAHPGFAGMMASAVLFSNAACLLAAVPDPLVKIRFDGTTDANVANSGSLGGGGVIVFANDLPVISTNVPTGAFAPGANTASLDFGAIAAGQGGRAVDFTTAGDGTLGALDGFTITGWLNANNLAVGPGGNRVAFALASANGPGIDLAQLANGSLRVGINQWPDGANGGGPSSSAGKLTANANTPGTNWVFFAISYDSNLDAQNVKFYFGSPNQLASLDTAANYKGGIADTGGAILSTGPLTLGNFGPIIGARNETGANSRVFRGLMDEVQIFDRALTPAEIQSAQVNGATPVQAIAFVQQPAGQTVFAGQAISLQAKVTGSEPITYQWQRNSENITDATNAIYSFNITETDNQASYRVVASNAAGSTNSAAAVFTVLAENNHKLSLSFSGGTTVTNLGNLGGGGNFVRVNGFPSSSTSVPGGPFAPTENIGSLNFGAITGADGGRAVDLTNNIDNTLGAMNGFTLSGWLNSIDLQVGGGGNRILFALSSAGPGLDLVHNADGSLQLGVNQFPDNTPARSSAGWITADPTAGNGNWVFFAVTYDGTQSSGNVKFYFGSPTTAAALDFQALDYNRGVIPRTGTVTIGNFATFVGARTALGPTGSRNFRGLMDEINFFNKVLTDEEIVNLQKRAAYKPAVTNPVTITEHPKSALVFENQIVTFSTAFSGTPPFTFQWQKNNADILNETNETLTVTANLSDNNATYRVRISNAVGPVTSNPATLQVRADTGLKVSLSFSEGSGTNTVNAGDLGGSGVFVQRDGLPVFSENVPVGDFAPTNNTASVDFGAILAGQQGRAIDFTNEFGNTLGAMNAFTIAGWLNSVDLTVGPGGNRILFGLSAANGPGLDLVQLADGSLQLGVNQWPDNTPARSSAGWITADPTAAPANWVFFAITYDGTLEAGNVQFYFGSASTPATIDFGPLDYNRGVIAQSGPMTVGNFGAFIGARTEAGPNASRVFRGLMDEIKLFSKVLTPEEILQTQKAGATTVADEPSLAIAKEAQEIVLRWNSADSFKVLATDNLENQDWDPVTGTPEKNGNDYTLRLPISGNARYFRLQSAN